MTLSKKQIEVDKLKYRKWFWIYERDMLYLAKKFPAWRAKVHELGFQDRKIDSEWTHEDAGRRIKYMENPDFKE